MPWAYVKWELKNLSHHPALWSLILSPIHIANSFILIASLKYFIPLRERQETIWQFHLQAWLQNSSFIRSSVDSLLNLPTDFSILLLPRVNTINAVGLSCSRHHHNYRLGGAGVVVDINNVRTILPWMVVWKSSAMSNCHCEKLDFILCALWMLPHPFSENLPFWASLAENDPSWRSLGVENRFLCNLIMTRLRHPPPGTCVHDMIP